MHLPRILTFLRREQRLLALFLGGAALGFAFWKLASEMAEGDTEAFDRAILTGLRVPGDLATPIGPEWLHTAMVDITALGGVTVLTLVSVLAVAFLLLLGRYRQALLTAVATGGGSIVGKLLKSLFARERPEIVPHLVDVTSLSFPSGHSMNSAIVYLTIAVLLARGLAESRLRAFVIGIAVLLVLTIGFSRVYLGVHFPSDVLAGWSVGAAWALLMGLIASALQRDHKIEQPEGDNIIREQGAPLKR